MHLVGCLSCNPPCHGPVGWINFWPVQQTGCLYPTSYTAQEWLEGGGRDKEWIELMSLKHGGAKSKREVSVLSTLWCSDEQIARNSDGQFPPWTWSEFSGWGTSNLSFNQPFRLLRSAPVNTPNCHTFPGPTGAGSQRGNVKVFSQHVLFLVYTQKEQLFWIF